MIRSNSRDGIPAFATVMLVCVLAHWPRGLLPGPWIGLGIVTVPLAPLDGWFRRGLS